MKKYVKSRRKFKLFLLFMVSSLILVTIFILKQRDFRHQTNHVVQPLIDIVDQVYEAQQQVIVPEKYNEREVRSRLIQDKINFLTKTKDDDKQEGKDASHPAENITKHIHIFYSVPVSWYKRNKGSGGRKRSERISEGGNTTTSQQDSLKFLNTAFYPSLGLYKPTPSTFKLHFENIRNMGIGVIIVPLGPKLTETIFENVLQHAENYNISVTLEINAQNNKSYETIRDQLKWAKKFVSHSSFYKVFSIVKNSHLPMIYVKNANKIDINERFLCPFQPFSIRYNTLDAIYVAHIKFKQHTDLVRRLCFDGFYTRLASNGGTYASTWKNWSYLKAFATTYRMLFIPSVGPGFAEKNKFPRHGNIQRHRSNGRYYGVAWRTAIANHVGFISVSSYNIWQDGTQIEEAITRTGFMDYAPGSDKKYLELTSHWVQNFLKTESKSPGSCYELFNNTIC